MIRDLLVPLCNERFRGSIVFKPLITVPVSYGAGALLHHVFN